MTDFAKMLVGYGDRKQRAGMAQHFATEATHIAAADTLHAHLTRYVALLEAIARAAAHARSLERAADFKTMEAWHEEATKRYAALDASLAALDAWKKENGHG